MRNAMSDAIPTYADFDLGRRNDQIAVQFAPSRQKSFPCGQTKQNITFILNPKSRGEWLDKCPVASGDDALVPVISYLCLGDINAAGGEAWFDWRAAPDASEGCRSETIALLPNTAARRFLETITQNISDDQADVLGEGGNVASQPAVGACLAIASTLSDIVAMKPSLKYAAFVEESGGISLVIQSAHPGRRANFRVSPDGSQIAVVAVTSLGQASTNPVRIDDAETLRGWIEWLRKRE